MRRAALLLILLAFAPASAEEETGTKCVLYAVVDEGDAGMLKVYDGLRKGLELAQLPRVCREPQAESEAERSAFLRRMEVGERVPVFAIGDRAVRYLGGPMAGITRVFAFERYTAGGRPLGDLPIQDHLAIVYAARPAERVGAILRRLTLEKQVRAVLPLVPKTAADGPHARAFAKAAGIEFVAAEEKGKKPQVVLHLRFSDRGRLSGFREALAIARRLGVPLVSDERSRFGQGAAVTLVGRHDLVGKAAAECARRLRKDPELEIPPYGLPGVEVWVDLGAADAQGLEMPLPFLARADRLERGKRRRPKR